MCNGAGNLCLSRGASPRAVMIQSVLPGKAIINEREFHKDLCGATVTPRQGAI